MMTQIKNYRIKKYRSNKSNTYQTDNANQMQINMIIQNKYIFIYISNKYTKLSYLP